MPDDFLRELIEEAWGCISDAERWQVIRRAWVGYEEKGAGHFDWDFDSREVMSALLASEREPNA